MPQYRWVLTWLYYLLLCPLFQYEFCIVLEILVCEFSKGSRIINTISLLVLYCNRIWKLRHKLALGRGDTLCLLLMNEVPNSTSTASLSVTPNQTLVQKSLLLMCKFIISFNLLGSWFAFPISEKRSGFKLFIQVGYRKDPFTKLGPAPVSMRHSTCFL